MGGGCAALAASQRGLRGNVLLEVWPSGWAGFWVMEEEAYSHFQVFHP